MSMSPLARSEMRRSGGSSISRAWRAFLIAARRAEQPNNDRYVMAFCIYAAVFLAGYFLAAYHHERATARAAQHATTKGQP
jgi:hypothetical protein